jgi:cytochrome b561
MLEPTDTAANRRYSAGAILLHWTIAALVVTNIVLGLQAEDLKGLALFNLLQWHKSFGVTVLVLSVARLAWRLVNPPPPYPAHMPAWEKAAAAATHWGFYILMIGLPLTGWILVSASPLNIPTLLYKAIPWPFIGPVHDLPLGQRKGVEDLMGEVHETLARAMALLLILHVAAALKHHFRDRDLVFWRMAPLPGLKPRPPRGENPR